MNWLIAVALFWLAVTLYFAIRRLILRTLIHCIDLVIAILKLGSWLTGLITNRLENAYRNSPARSS